MKKNSTVRDVDTDGDSPEDVMEKINTKYNKNNNATLIYKDGSKPKNTISTGASMIIEDQQEALQISLPRRCLSYTLRRYEQLW